MAKSAKKVAATISFKFMLKMSVGKGKVIPNLERNGTEVSIIEVKERVSFVSVFYLKKASMTVPTKESATTQICLVVIV
jgi:hypothetical protein